MSADPDTRRMEDAAVGLLIRALRRHRGLRQSDVGRVAGVSRHCVSEIERGRLTGVTLRTLRHVGRALDTTLSLAPRWRGPELDRLLDAAHARLVEQVVSGLRAARWQVLVEYTFSHSGERGSIDVVGWHEPNRALVVVEVKTRIADLQDLLATHDRKVRLAPRLLAAERGWQAAVVGRLLVVSATHANRDAIRRHAATVGSVLPATGRDARRWLTRPVGSLGAVWFMPSTGTGGTHARSAPERVRRPRPVPNGRVPRSRAPADSAPSRSHGEGSPAARPYHQR